MGETPVNRDPEAIEIGKEQQTEKKTATSDNSSGFVPWLDRHRTTIPIITGTLAVVISILSFLNSCRALNVSRDAQVVSQRQLETRIEPRLEISYGYNITNIRTKLITNVVMVGGVPVKDVVFSITNLTPAEVDALKKGLSDYSRATLSNAGTVAISDVRLFLWGNVKFSERLDVTNQMWVKVDEILAESLPPGHSLMYDFGGHALLRSMLERAPSPSGIGKGYFVLKYRRSVDGTPKFKLVPFSLVKTTLFDDTFVFPFDRIGHLFSFSRSEEVPAERKMIVVMQGILRELGIGPLDE